jgi:hypothetical protein
MEPERERLQVSFLSSLNKKKVQQTAKRKKKETTNQIDTTKNKTGTVRES